MKLDPYRVDLAIEHCKAMLAQLGIVGDERTAWRHVKALSELTRGLREPDPARHLEVQFPPVSSEPGLIVVQNVPFTSVCEHHILPFWGLAVVGYVPKPDAEIVGLSKLARLVADYGARPQVQERLGEQVVSAIMTQLPAQGAAVAIRGVHTCMALRGAQTGTGAVMLTSRKVGAINDQPYLGEWLNVTTPLFSGWAPSGVEIPPSSSEVAQGALADPAAALAPPVPADHSGPR